MRCYSSSGSGGGGTISHFGRVGRPYTVQILDRSRGGEFENSEFPTFPSTPTLPADDFQILFLLPRQRRNELRREPTARRTPVPRSSPFFTCAYVHIRTVARRESWTLVRSSIAVVRGIPLYRDCYFSWHRHFVVCDCAMRKLSCVR